MRKRTLLISFALLSILIAGCVKEEVKDIDNNQEAIEEIEMDEVEEVEGIEVPYDELRAESIKREELGEYTFVREMEVINASVENESIKITVTDYKLSTLKPKDEYREFFMELESEDLDEIAILDIILVIENLSNDILEINCPEGIIFTNTGEEIPVILDFSDEKREEVFKLSGKQLKKGSTSVILSSVAEDIESFKLIYDDLELDFE